MHPLPAVNPSDSKSDWQLDHTLFQGPTQPDTFLIPAPQRLRIMDLCGFELLYLRVMVIESCIINTAFQKADLMASFPPPASCHGVSGTSFLVFLQDHKPVFYPCPLHGSTSFLSLPGLLPPQAPGLLLSPLLPHSAYSVLSIILVFIYYYTPLKTSVNSVSQRQMEKILPHIEKYNLE